MYMYMYVILPANPFATYPIGLYVYRYNYIVYILLIYTYDHMIYIHIVDDHLVHN